MAQNDMNPPDMLRQKQEDFFALHKALDDDSDDAPDLGRQASMQKVNKNAARRRRTQLKENSNSGLPRSASDTNLASKDRQPPVNNQAERVAPSSSAGNARLPASLITRHTFSGAPSKPEPPANAPTAMTRITGKRKRGEVQLIQIPEDQQVFKGLYFYFFPNNDTNPARKMRINKAREFGATWLKNYNDSVTHVIVDKAMDYTSLTKYLKLDALPADVVIVSESYPAECLSFRALIDPRLPQFKVKGYEVKTGRPAGSGSDTSLPLKPAGKAVMARQPETQTSGKRATTPREEASSDDEGLQIPPMWAAEKPSAEIKTGSDEFDAAIRQARELQSMPLDDEESDSRPTSSAGPPTYAAQEAGLTTEKKKGKLRSMQDRFQCMQSHTGSTTNNPNSATIAILDQMAHYYDRIGDEWRTLAYRKANATLRNHPLKVRTKQEALALPQIGERLATKIEEIAFTNRLRRLDNTKTDANDQILQTFMGIYGVGFAQASKWVDLGYTTLDELAQKAELTDNQRIGLAHYEDFQTRIPRAEVEVHGAIVRKALLAIDPNFQVVVGGSYRRGAETSGDIDCIITHTNASTEGSYIRTVVLDQLVPKLFRQDFLTAALAATSRDDGSKWHGACHLPPVSTANSSRDVTNPWRRIDLLLVPPSELGAALIYFTGNDIFNRSLRLLASTKGMRLNQRGLYKDVIRGKGREKVTEGTLVEGRDERRIFEVLGVPWREAWERIP